MCIAGIACVLWGNAMPATSNAVAASQAFMDWCTDSGVDQEGGERYLALLTPRYQWINIGVGIGTLGASLLFLSLHNWFVRRKSDEKGHGFRTPSTRVAFFVVGILALGWSWASEIVGLDLDLARQMYPWCADTVIIPMVGLTVLFSAIAAVCGIIGLIIVLGFGSLPADLRAWDHTRPARSWIISSIFAAAALCIVVLGFNVVQSASSIAMPAYVAVMYLLLSTRAALLNTAHSADG